MSSELLDRLRAATEGSRELDAEILASLGSHVLERRGRDKKEWWYPTDGRRYGRLDPNPYAHFQGVPHYTTDLQAALSLKPAGLNLTLWERDDHEVTWQQWWATLSRPNGGEDVAQSISDSGPALALTTACIAARERDDAEDN